MVELCAHNALVAGSSPAASTKIFDDAAVTSK
jgi:hypothetical protein